MDPPMTPNELLMELECPVCYTYIAAPVRQCANLHPMCAKCFRKVDKCPVCRQAKITARNHVLERLHAILDIPCQYHMNGCSFKVKGTLIKTHEAVCAYRSMPCPMSFAQDCLWEGPWNKIEEHCRKSHSENLIFGPDASLIATDFKNTVHSVKYLTNFYVFDRIFRLYWDISVNTGDVRFSITFHGFPEDNDRFSYRIRFIKKKTSRVARSLFGRCRNATNQRFLLVPGSTVGTNFGHIKDYCCDHGNLEFFVKIKENCADESSRQFA